MFGDLNWPLNVSPSLSAIAELLLFLFSFLYFNSFPFRSFFFRGVALDTMKSFYILPMFLMYSFSKPTLSGNDEPNFSKFYRSATIIRSLRFSCITGDKVQRFTVITFILQQRADWPLTCCNSVIKQLNIAMIKIYYHACNNIKT